MIDIRRQKADLHIHTCYSDGEAEPASIVKTAARLGYDVIAVTDHDNFGGVREAVETGRREGLEVITGIELAAETEESDFIYWDMEWISIIRSLRQRSGNCRFADIGET